MQAKQQQTQNELAAAQQQTQQIQIQHQAAGRSSPEGQDQQLKGALDAANQDRSRLQDLLKKATAEANARKQSVELLSAEAERARRL